jgi:hypothetical protein
MGATNLPDRNFVNKKATIPVTLLFEKGDITLPGLRNTL